MKTLKFFALLSALTALPVLGDVEALYWQVTSDMNPEPIAFSAAAFAAVDGSGTVSYLTDAAGNAWQAANADSTTAVIASLLSSDTYSSGYSFYIELMNQDAGGNWYTAGSVNNNGVNYSWSDIQAHVYSSSSMSMSLATPLTSGTAHIPEPTSGLLMLFGGALLALRRRRG
ncbi:MAG: PEP-CTERM sorting domain-containing protein [Kiritimatiellae bacterium]|nr:PEP-CTERM sorting domain-containing protein [Kiritimatiellia bacterium]